jgi:hypothetical protein
VWRSSRSSRVPARSAAWSRGNDWWADLLEAEARLLAAKDGLDADLPAAIGFFRRVEASAYLAEAEGLLATTRSA